MVVLGENIHQWELSDENVIGVTRLEIKDLMTSFSEFSEPILQIGSKSSILDKHGGKWRNLYREKTFIGIDIESGENVDCVFDISDNISKLRRQSRNKAVFNYDMPSCFRARPKSLYCCRQYQKTTATER